MWCGWWCCDGEKQAVIDVVMAVLIMVVIVVIYAIYGVGYSDTMMVDMVLRSMMIATVMLMMSNVKSHYKVIIKNEYGTCNCTGYHDSKNDIINVTNSTDIKS